MQLIRQRCNMLCNYLWRWVLRCFAYQEESATLYFPPSSNKHLQTLTQCG